MKKLLLSISLFCSLQALAQSSPQFSLVKDIFPGTRGSMPSALTYCNGKIFFTAISSVSMDWEIGITDGTAAGTKFVTDIKLAGPNPTVSSKLTVFNNKVFFVAYTAATGYELYVTDGTATGTSLVMDINPGADDSNPDEFIEYNGKLYFVASTAANGRELWVTDGTATGTSMVKDLSASTDMAKGACNLAVVLGKLYFTSKVIGECDLYVSDGTASGTTMLKSFSSVGVGPQRLTELNGKAYFFAVDLVGDNELWETDGTAIGTTMLKDINPGGSSVSPTPNAFPMVIYNGKLAFTADDGAGKRLWLSDGTAGGTIKVHPDMEPISDGFYVYNNLLFLVNKDRQVLVSDGTAAGTKELDAEVANANVQFHEFYGKLYFTAESNATGMYIYGPQLWQTDGTLTGTQMLMPNPPVGGYVGFAQDHSKASIGSDLYFTANYSGTADGHELYKMSLFPTAVNDAVISASQCLYPNPTTGTVNIKLPIVKDASVAIYSLTGQLMMQQSISAEVTTVNVKHLAPGQYITHITTDGKTTIEKLVKQ